MEYQVTGQDIAFLVEIAILIILWWLFHGALSPIEATIGIFWDWFHILTFTSYRKGNEMKFKKWVVVDETGRVNTDFGVFYADSFEDAINHIKKVLSKNKALSRRCWVNQDNTISRVAFDSRCYKVDGICDNYELKSPITFWHAVESDNVLTYKEWLHQVKGIDYDYYSTNKKAFSDNMRDNLKNAYRIYLANINL